MNKLKIDPKLQTKSTLIEWVITARASADLWREDCLKTVQQLSAMTAERDALLKHVQDEIVKLKALRQISKETIDGKQTLGASAALGTLEEIDKINKSLS